MAHVISADGIKPDPVKVSAVVNMPSPQNKEELRSFLGLVNYLGKFIISALLFQLLKKDSEWIFNYPQMRLKVKLRMHLCSSFFYPELPTRVSCDASSYGPGAALEQFNSENWYPITYAFRSLTLSEKN